MDATSLAFELICHVFHLEDLRLPFRASSFKLLSRESDHKTIRASPEGTYLGTNSSTQRVMGQAFVMNIRKYWNCNIDARSIPAGNPPESTFLDEVYLGWLIPQVEREYFHTVTSTSMILDGTIANAAEDRLRDTKIGDFPFKYLHVFYFCNRQVIKFHLRVMFIFSTIQNETMLLVLGLRLLSVQLVVME